MSREIFVVHKHYMYDSLNLCICPNCARTVIKREIENISGVLCCEGCKKQVERVPSYTFNDKTYLKACESVLKRQIHKTRDLLKNVERELIKVRF